MHTALLYSCTLVLLYNTTHQPHIVQGEVEAGEDGVGGRPPQPLGGEVQQVLPLFDPLQHRGVLPGGESIDDD